MTRVTMASIAYVATQVHPAVSIPSSLTLITWQLHFALLSSSVFGRSDTTTDSERFYESVLDFLEDPDEKDFVDELLDWWNW